MGRGVHKLGASMREGWHTGGTRSRARSSCSPVFLPVSWQRGCGEAVEGKVGRSLCSAWAESPFTFQHIHWPPWYRGSWQPLLPEREVPEWWRPASSSLPGEQCRSPRCSCHHHHQYPLHRGAMCRALTTTLQALASTPGKQSLSAEGPPSLPLERAVTLSCSKSGR